MDELARVVRSRNSVRFCPECGEKLAYTAVHGIYNCKNCGYSERDTYGKMKALLDKHPNMTKVEIASALGVPIREINRYITDGVLENPQGNIN